MEDIQSDTMAYVWLVRPEAVLTTCPEWDGQGEEPIGMRIPWYSIADPALKFISGASDQINA